MVIFHSYVNLPEGSKSTEGPGSPIATPQAPAHRHGRHRRHRRESSRPRAHRRPPPAEPKNRPSKNARTTGMSTTDDPSQMASCNKPGLEHVRTSSNYRCWLNQLTWGLSHQVPPNWGKWCTFRWVSFVENGTEIHVSEAKIATCLDDLRWSSQ